jgi:zinc protease
VIPPMGRRVIVVVLAFAALIVQRGSLEGAQPAKPWVPDVEVETFKLENGLTVVFHEDHKTPLVSVYVTYNVGSKDDPPGRTGFAHLFEHMMFQGSAHSDETYHGPIYPYSTDSQGTTSEDLTVYSQTVTPNALERVLWLESDRMGFLSPSVTVKKLENVREVVKNERRETLDDLPRGEVEEALRRELYPPGHPYRNLTLGSMADLSAARLADFLRFSRKYYQPNNAFLCIAGDFDSLQARRWVEKYFGTLSSGTPVHALQPQVPVLTRAHRIVLYDRVNHPFSLLVWPTVPAHHADEAALDVLASVLGGSSRGSRLFRALTYDRQVASSATAAHPTHRLAGTFEVYLTAKAGQKLDEVVRLADAEIEQLKVDGPSADEVRKVKIERRRTQILALESTSSKASTLNHYAASCGDPLGYRTVLARVLAVTPEEVKRVANAYLQPARIEVDVFPGERVASPWHDNFERGNPEPEPEPEHVEDIPRVHRLKFVDRSVAPEVGPNPDFVPLRIERRRLSNGLKVIIAVRRDLPHVRLKLVVNSGETAVPRSKSGLPALAVNLLEEGTKSRSAFQFESELLETGAMLWTEGSLESTVVNLTAMTRQLDRALDLYADAILNPVFADKEFLRLKVARMEDLQSRTDSAQDIAEDVFPRLLYLPEHPYARTTRGTLESLRSITREEIIAFYRWTFVPSNATLIVAGDVVPDEIAGALEARFGSWPAGPVPKPAVVRSTPASAGGRTIYLIDKPGAENAVLYLGWISPSVHSPDRQGMVILKDKLGGRIASNLREERALTYGFTETVDFRRAPGPLVVQGSVHKFATRAAIAEVFKELNDLAGNRSINDEEINEIQEAKLPGWIERFETGANVGSQLVYMASHNLPDHYLTRELAGFKAVKAPHIDRLVKQYLSPRRMTILIVGDRSWIEEPLRSLRFVRRIVLLDAHGNPLSDPTPTQPELAPVTNSLAIKEGSPRSHPPAAIPADRPTRARSPVP